MYELYKYNKESKKWVFKKKFRTQKEISEELDICLPTCRKIIKGTSLKNKRYKIKKK